MNDRVVQFPNRYKLTPVSGDIYDLTPEPGIVTEPGTDLNKANLLKDATAAAYGLGVNAVPDDVLAAIKTALDGKPRIETGSYTGTGTYGKSNPNSLTFNSPPKFIIISGILRFLCLVHPDPYAVAMPGSGSSYDATVVWSDNTVTWYMAGASSGTQQMNASDSTYYYIAIL